MNSKSVLRSKTMWTNLILGLAGLLAAFIPSVGEYVNEKVLLMVFPVVNMVLRLISKDKVYLFD